MGKNENKASDAGKVQLFFELTMDNPEDQEKLNRQLRKAGEPDRCTRAKVAGLAQGELTTESPKTGP
jgi:hypothetical protein